MIGQYVSTFNESHEQITYLKGHIESRDRDLQFIPTKMPKPVKATKPAAQTAPAATQKEQPIKWPPLRPKKGLTLESILDDQIYIIDVSRLGVCYLSSCSSISDSDLRLVNLTITADFRRRTCSARKNVKLSSGLARRSSWRTQNLREKTRQRGRTVSRFVKELSDVDAIPFC
jgi:hypothetical protein